MSIQAEGQLRHRFFGVYSALIVLGFNSDAEAKQALPILNWSLPQGERWKTFPGSRALIWRGESEALTRVTKLLVRFGADGQAISSMEKSIDFGEPFRIKIG